MNEIKIIKKEDKIFPQKLLEIKNCPKLLYAIGNIELLYNNSIAIVGARNCTEYGAKYAKEFGEALSKKGITIVSGMAIGIDKYAHIGALRGKGKTIAVLGSGFNYIYPEENLELYGSILKNDGLVISEYEPNCETILSKFPYRNRIISGLSNGTLIIEARNRSGSLVTARYSYEQQKNIYCIPSNLGIVTGGGTNNLIKENKAKLVTNANDILEEFGFLNEVKENNVEIKVEKEYKAIYDVVSYMPTNINLIAKKSNLNIAEVSQKLIIMEIKGYIKAVPGNCYIRSVDEQ